MSELTPENFNKDLKALLGKYKYALVGVPKFIQDGNAFKVAADVVIVEDKKLETV